MNPVGFDGEGDRRLGNDKFGQNLNAIAEDAVLAGLVMTSEKSDPKSPVSARWPCRPPRRTSPMSLIGRGGLVGRPPDLLGRFLQGRPAQGPRDAALAGQADDIGSLGADRLARTLRGSRAAVCHLLAFPERQGLFRRRVRSSGGASSGITTLRASPTPGPPPNTGPEPARLERRTGSSTTRSFPRPCLLTCSTPYRARFDHPHNNLLLARREGFFGFEAATTRPAAAR